MNTAPADTTRAMHAAEMRGQDMQDAPERICVAGTPQECGQYFPSCVEAEGAWGGVGVEYVRTDLCISEAECQRRIDAAVQAERAACAAVAAKHAETGRKKLAASETRQEACNWALIVTRSDLIEDAIRARGQK